MSLKQEIIEYSMEYGLDVDSNLYTSVFLCLLVSRHLVITSEDFRKTDYELSVILDVYWRIGLRSLTVTKKTTIEDLKVLVSQGVVFVIIGLDNLDKELQLEFLDMILKGHRGKELASIIGVVKDPTKLIRYFRDIFWFQQIHNTENITEVLTIPTITSFNRNKLHQFLQMRGQLSSITVVPEMRRYAYDIVTFVRCHRCVSAGLATTHIEELVLLGKALCLAFGRQFVVPTIFKLAARKLIPLHIEIVSPEHEPSLQWGSDPELVEELIKRSNGTTVVEDVLRKVSVPI